MKLTDFEYAGEKLSAKGCIVVTFDSSGTETKSLGSDLTFNTVRDNNSFVQRKITTTYGDVYTSDPIQIIKYNCDTFVSEPFTEEEVRGFNKWLKRKSYEKLRPIYDGVYGGTYFKGSFTSVNAIELAGNIIGLEITFTTNAPYGFGEDVSASHEVPTGGAITLNTGSDEIGYIYPTLKVTCTSAGDLTIADTEDRKTIVKNCSVNEVITFSGSTKVITTSLKSHTKLPQEFNYIYPRLTTTYSSDANKLTFSLPCKVVISYTPIRKVGIL